LRDFAGVNLIAIDVYFISGWLATIYLHSLQTAGSTQLILLLTPADNNYHGLIGVFPLMLAASSSSSSPSSCFNLFSSSYFLLALCFVRATKKIRSIIEFYKRTLSFEQMMIIIFKKHFKKEKRS